MCLIIKDAAAVYLKAASRPERVDVNIEGVKIEDILKQVDISDAINYYGIEELLDAIGESEARIYFRFQIERREK